MTINLLGKPVAGIAQDGSTLYVSDRWPFRATICALDSGETWGALSSGGFVVYQWPQAQIDAQSLAIQIDAISKAVFQECTWYQGTP